MKFSFLEFDEQDVLKEVYRLGLLAEAGPEIDHMFATAKYQHSKNAAIMKRLIEIIEMQQNQIMGFVMCLQEHGSNINPEALIAIYQKRLVAVENKSKELETK